MTSIRAAIYSGVAAGIISTIAQLALWSVVSDSVPAMLFRDARLVAAMIMGPGVLPPPATFDWQVMLVATLVHFALSILYGLMLAWVISRLPGWPSIIVGIVFGLVLYAVNMYGFTVLFPWFEVSRDWVTATSHVVFGVAVVLVYEALARRQLEHESPRDGG